MTLDWFGFAGCWLFVTQIEAWVVKDWYIRFRNFHALRHVGSAFGWATEAVAALHQAVGTEVLLGWNTVWEVAEEDQVGSLMQRELAIFWCQISPALVVVEEPVEELRLGDAVVQVEASVPLW